MSRAEDGGVPQVEHPKCHGPVVMGDGRNARRDFFTVTVRWLAPRIVAGRCALAHDLRSWNWESQG
jgi:hypothetical protein